MRSIDALTIEALEIITEAVGLFTPAHIYAGFSGGYDSLVSTHLASTVPGFSGAFHANTGIGVEETRQYVREVCLDYGWPLREITTPHSYEAEVVKNGFPGPALHYIMYRRLKDRCVDQLLRDVKTARSQRVMLIAGARASESQRRMGTTQPWRKRRAQVWVNPCIHWSGDEVRAYKAYHQLPDNPVREALGMSGECLCGAHAKPGELARICQHFPATGAEIVRIESLVREAGHTWGWEGAPPRGRRAALADIAGAIDGSPMCASCDVRHSQGA